MTMKKESAFDRIGARSPLYNKVFVAKALDMADQVAAVLAERGMSQRDLARLLEKGDSEVSKWLSGMHNPTLETIAKLEAALGVDLLVTRLNPDGYFNRRHLTKLTVNPVGGTHKLRHEVSELAFGDASGQTAEAHLGHIKTKIGVSGASRAQQPEGAVRRLKTITEGTVTIAA